MHMVFLFGFLWLKTGNPQYQAAFNKNVEGMYAGSDAKVYAEAIKDKAKDKSPVLTAIGPVGYSLFVRKQAQFSSSKVGIPGAVTTYSYNNNIGSINFTWSW